MVDDHEVEPTSPNPQIPQPKDLSVLTRASGLFLASAVILTGCAAPSQPTHPVESSNSTPISAAPKTPTTPTVVVDDKGLKVASDESQPDGPQTFAIDSGKIYVHDGMANAVRIYSLAGKFQRSVRFAEWLNIADFAVRGDSLTVLDGEGGLHWFKIGATKLTETRFSEMPPLTLPEPDAEPINVVSTPNISYFGDQLVAQIWIDGNQVLTKGSFLKEPVGMLVRPRFVAEEGDTAMVKTNSGVLLRAVTLPDELVLAYETYRDKGYTYTAVMTRKYLGLDTWEYQSVVFKCTDAGQLVASFTLKPNEKYDPFREFAFSGGDVYQLWIGTDRAQVLKLSPDQ